MAKKLTTKSKVWMYCLLGLMVTFAPIACEIVLHKNTYFATKDAGWSLTIGGVIAVIMVGLAMFGKLSKFLGSGIRVVGTIFVLAYFLEPILVNLKLLSFLLLCGMIAEGIFIKPKIRQLTKQLDNEGTAKVLREVLNGK